MIKTLKFNLIDNALDSLEHAIGHLTAKSNLEIGDYKIIIRDLTHVTELLLKERLRMFHPAFMLTNVDKYPSKSAHTVSTECAIERLKNIISVAFSDRDHSALRTIREKRNEIEHFEFSINEAEAKIVIGNILVFIFRFSSDEIGLDWAKRRLSDPAWSKLNEYAAFYEALLEDIYEQIDSDKEIPIVDCPICHNGTFNLYKKECLLCRHREELTECKICRESYFYSSVEYEEAGLCPKCEDADGYATAHYEKY